MIFVDTNYFLRFVLRDNELQYVEAKKLFLEAAKGKIELITSTVVFFEIHFVLKSFYKKDKSFLVETLSKILNLSVVFPEKQLLQASLNFYEKSAVGLEDCYNIAFSKMVRVNEFKTFDINLRKELEKIVGKRKVELFDL